MIMFSFNKKEELHGRVSANIGRKEDRNNKSKDSLKIKKTKKK
jgi:hypothetical protein